MSKEVKISGHSQPQAAGRSKRLMWVAAVFAAAAITFGADAGQGFDRSGSTSITATPENPCLFNHTCGEDNLIAEDQMQGKEAQAECELLKERYVEPPDCALY